MVSKSIFNAKTVDKNNVAAIVCVLEEIIEQYPDCIIDVTGGEDLYIFAAGIVCERHRDKKVQVHYINIRSDVAYDCDMDGEKIVENNPLRYRTKEKSAGSQVTRGYRPTATSSLPHMPHRSITTLTISAGTPTGCSLASIPTKASPASTPGTGRASKGCSPTLLPGISI